MKSVVLILDITNDCNLNCSYCYISGGEKQDVMAVDVAYTAIKKVSERFNCKVNILFHGGEPLLYFEVIKELVTMIEKQPFAVPIEYYIQTNCINMTKEMASYMKEKKISIGVSLDGIDEYGNSARITREGQSSVEKVKKGINLLSEANNQISVLSVLTSNNYTNFSETVGWFVENNILSFTLNPFIVAGRGAMAKLSISGYEMFVTYSQLLDQIIQYNKQGIKIREKNLYYMYKAICENQKSYMCMNSPCGAGLALFAVNPEGNIYPCADFCNEDLFCIGNVKDDFFSYLTSNKIWRQMRAATLDEISGCNQCQYKNICPSGCTARRYYSNNSLYSIDTVCEFYKYMIPYMKNDRLISEMREIWG